MSRTTAMPDTAHRAQLRRYEQAIADLERFEQLAPQAVPAYQLALLNDQLKYAMTRSPHYRKAWAAAGAAGGLGSVAELAKLPFTTKADLRAGYPFGFLAAPREELIRYGESTGTTGSPTSAAITYADWIGGNVSVERALGHIFGPSDLVFIAIPYELAFASYDVDRALEHLGAAVVAVGTLTRVCPFERMVAMMHTVRPSGLVCTPSRALRLFDLLRADGYDPLAVGLRTFLYIGETCSPIRLEKIAEHWQVQLTTAYGSTETNSLGLACARGGLHLTEDRHAFEVVDPVTGEPVASDTNGDLTGELVLTTLCAQAMPLLRYRTGDLVTVAAAPCPCGSPRRTLRHHGRVSEQIQLGDQIIIKVELEQVILSTPGTRLYYAAGVREGQLVIRVECSGRLEEVCSDVADRVAAAYGVVPDVKHVDAATVMAAMDRMLKPGSLSLDDLAAV
jgi:phenylacetate-CoA ligase